MKNGESRFSYYTMQINELLINAQEQYNPSLWLFNNNARTPFFMLEGLAKLYGDMHNPKKLGKLKEHFKMVEDGLGQIDYYNWLSLAFAKKKEIPEEYKIYIRNQLDLKTIDLNKLLVDNGWLSVDNKRMLKISKILKEVDWMKPNKELNAISAFYKKSIKGITKFVSETNYSFDNVEEDVHELRRQLRWLSIYPQALQGAIQYSKKTTKETKLEKYMTPEILKSSFNKMPSKGNNTSLLLIDKNYFLALSWMIARLGSLKDEGLLITGLYEAIKQSASCTDEEAMAKGTNLLGEKQRKMQEILDEAEVITRMFFKDNILKHLIVKS